MKTYKYISFLGLWLSTLVTAFAQQNVEMADTFRANGKIYVVVAVLVAILLGLFGYLVVTDRKVRQLENEFKANQED